MKLKMKVRREKRKKQIIIVAVILSVMILISTLIGIIVSRNADKGTGSSVPNNSFEIKTKYCTLYYPKVWEKNIKVKYSDKSGYKVEFYGSLKGKEKQHLFDVCFNSDDGSLLGYFDREEVVNVSIEIMEIEFGSNWSQEEMDQIYSMQEDANYVIEWLEKEKDYKGTL